MRQNLSESRNLGRWRMEDTFSGELELLLWPLGRTEVKAKGLTRVRSLIEFPLWSSKAYTLTLTGKLEANPPHSLHLTWGEKCLVLSRAERWKVLRGWYHELIVSWISKFTFPSKKNPKSPKSCRLDCCLVTSKCKSLWKWKPSV